VLDADDAAVPTIGRRKPGRFQHSLVVRELEEVSFALARSKGILDNAVFEPGPIDCGAQSGDPSPLWFSGLQRHVVLDVDRAIPASRRCNEEIRLPNSSPLRVGRKSCSKNELGLGCHSRNGGSFDRIGVLAVDDNRIWVETQQVGDDLGFEQPTALEATLQNGRGWERLGRKQRVVLGSHGTLLGDVAALQRHSRHVATRGHGQITQVLSAIGHREV
jgi:hypothetical protein